MTCHRNPGPNYDNQCKQSLADGEQIWTLAMSCVVPTFWHTLHSPSTG
jgi:hypothetical protein